MPTVAEAPRDILNIPPGRRLIRDRLKLEPTGPEQAAILDSDTFLDMISGGEQGGKSFIIAWRATERIMELDRPGIYWLVGRKYENTEREYDYMLENFQALGWVKDYSDTQPDKRRYIELQDGTIIKTITVGEEMNIAKEAPDGIIGCEASQLSLEAFNKLRLRTAAGHGWLLLAGTFESGIGWFASTFRRWMAATDQQHGAFILPSWTNTHVYPGGKDDPALLSALVDVGDEDFFWERIGGIPRLPAGLVFRDHFDPEVHVRDVRYIDGLPVEIAVDPGYNPSAHALLAIQCPPEAPIQVFDEIYERKITTEEMCDLAMDRPWWKDVVGGAIDHSATKMQQTVTPPQKVWIAKTGITLKSRHVPIMAGIDRLKTYLRPEPLTYRTKTVWSPVCRGSLSELGMIESPITGKEEAYSWKILSTGAVSGKTPLDKFNHAIKAFIYWLVAKFGFVTPGGPRVVRRYT